jgi:hypothetical protein
MSEGVVGVGMALRNAIETQRDATSKTLRADLRIPSFGTI